MKNIIDNLLHRYEKGDHVQSLKARFLLLLCFAGIIIIPITAIYTIYLDLNNPELNYSINPPALAPIFVGFILILIVTILMIRGYFTIAAHGGFILAQAIVWVVMFNDTTTPISRIDTMVILIAIHSMSPLIITRRPIVITFYAVTNIVLIFLFMRIQQIELNLHYAQMWEAFADASAAVLLTTIITYNLFTILHRALYQSESRKRGLEQANKELTAANEEFEAQNEELNASQTALMASEKEFRAIFNGSHDAFIIYDSKGQILEVNDRMLQMYGLSRKKALTLTIEDISMPDWHSEKAAEFWEKTMEDEEVLFESQALRPEHGTLFDIEVGMKHLKRRGQDCVLASIRDISDRVHADKKLKRREEQYRKLFESNNDAILIVKDLIIIECNNQTLEMFGRSQEDLIGKTPLDLSPPIQPDGRTSREAGMAKIKAALSGTRQVFPWVHLRHDGTPFYAEISLILIETTEGNLIQAIVRDVDEREKAAREIRESLEEKTVLIKEIHHRVKNNMQVISSILNLQAMTVNDPHTRRQLQDAVSRIYSMAKIHEKVYRTKNFSKIDMASYISELYKEILHIHEHDASDINVRAHLDPVFMAVDQAVPCGLIINEVLTNSIKHGCKDTWKCEIELGISLEDDMIKIVIADNGPGFMYHPDQPAGAKSLGMNIIEALTRQLNAEYTIDTTNGTRFIMRFPEKSQTLSVGQIPNFITKEKTGKVRVLIVEDEQVTALNIKHHLIKAGYEVVATVNSGEQAVEAFKAYNPDIAIMDILLQGTMTGVEAAEAIVNISPVQLFFTTAIIDPDINDRILALLNNDKDRFFTKPISITNLISKIDKISSLQKK